MSDNHPHPLLDWLARPATYSERPPSVEHVETHISHVFLTGQFAYKLKKPVRFDFLDFSTPQLRRQACETEVRLNRRLAPDVYLGVVTVRRDPAGKLSLDERTDETPADSQIVDSLVKMRRLPAEAALLERIRTRHAAEEDAHAIATRLSEFYRHLKPVPLAPAQYRAEIERHVRANREVLLAADGLDPVLVNRLHGAQLRMLRLRPELFDQRVHAGRIVDGHGDLRPDHIYLAPDVVIIDCIEFNAEFRQLDVADELSFLETECDFVGAETLGRQIFERTLANLGDAPPKDLVAFYRSYRACVRAKVASLRAQQLSGDSATASLAEARRHLHWADRYDDQLPRPVLLVMSGLMGSGKSTLAAALADALGCEILSTDSIRRDQYGASPSAAEYGAGNYRPELRHRVYDEMHSRAARLLDAGQSVVLDGAYLQTDLRATAVALAKNRQLTALVVHCRCDEQIARQRIETRAAKGKTLSEARPELLDDQRAELETDPPGLPAVEVDTTTETSSQIDRVIRLLRGD